MNVQVYSEPGMASVNSYIVEGDAEVVVIDAQRSISSAARLVERVKEIGKPTVAVFLTHPHPDHFGGLPTLMNAFEGVPLYALAPTRDSLANGANGLIDLSKQVLGDDFDTDIPLPDRILQNGETLVLAGLTFQASDAGRGEAACMLLLHLSDHDTLFCADVVQHNMTAFLLEGHLQAWLEQIEAVSKTYGNVQTVYPGHGPSGPAHELFAFQRNYLQTFNGLVLGQKTTDDHVSPGGKAHIVQEMNRLYPGFLPVAMIPDLLEQDIDAVAAPPEQ